MFFCRQKGKRLKQPTFKQLPVYRPHSQIPWTVCMGGRQKMNAAIGNLRHCLHIAWLCDLIDRNPLGIHGPYQHIDGLPLAAPGQHICVASYCKLWNPLPDRCNLSAFVTQSDPLVQLVREQTNGITQKGRFATAGRASQKQAFTFSQRWKQRLCHRQELTADSNGDGGKGADALNDSILHHRVSAQPKTVSTLQRQISGGDGLFCSIA